jgi:hypothetical protein
MMPELGTPPSRAGRRSKSARIVATTVIVRDDLETICALVRDKLRLAQIARSLAHSSTLRH